MRLTAIERRLEKLGPARKEETVFQKMLKKMSDAELERLGQILKRTEKVEEFTSEESAFWDDLCARYGEDHEPD